MDRIEYQQRAREMARRGNQITHARLNESAVREIRRNRHGLTMKQQAEIFGVHHRTIEKVRYYETWAHVRD